MEKERHKYSNWNEEGKEHYQEEEQWIRTVVRVRVVRSRTKLLYTVIVGRREISKTGTVVRMRCIIWYESNG
jgi:hypothetical protein